MKVVSIYNKRPMKWVKSGDTWARVPVHVPYHQKMAMVIMDVEGKKVTKHVLIDK